MITIPLTTEDLTKVRLAPSPLWETVFSFWVVLLHHGRNTVHAPWAARAQRVLPGTDFSPLVAAMCLERHCPDFLTPPPDASIAGFDGELERLRATPTEVVFEEVETLMRVEKELFGLPPEKERLLGTYLKDPDGSLKRLVDALGRYHDLAVAPYWPRMRELLEGDTLKRGQALALGGVEALLSNLHPKASYSGGVLELDKTYEAVVEPAGRGITLVPCAFAWPKGLVLMDPHPQPTLAYAPRGVANLWTSSSPTPNGTALEAALGAVRASVLKSLTPTPSTTTELAHQLHLSPAAISAHLSRLKAAELIEPHRSGRKVFYRLSGAGEELLGIFGELEQPNPQRT
jgi:DNA-binding transcriptional ArsR family regulator